MALAPPPSVKLLAPTMGQGTVVQTQVVNGLLSKSVDEFASIAIVHTMVKQATININNISKIVDALLEIFE